MHQYLHWLFYSNAGNTINNIALLCFRILLGIELFRVHGMKKLRPVNGKVEQVPNPLGLPEKLNSLIARFSDTAVPVLLVLGFLTRLGLLPATGVTLIGYFVVHRHDNAEVRDIPFMYSLCFLLLVVTGPGTYSLDNYLVTIFFHT